MTAPLPHNSGDAAPESHDPIAPQPDRSPAATAAELVAHGLLEFHHRKDAAAKEHRVARVLGALAKPEIPRTYAFPLRRVVKWSLAVAAVLVIGATLFLIGVPGETTALAEVRQSIAAMRAAGARRYEIRMVQSSNESIDSRPNAIVDSSGDLLLIRHTPPGSGDNYVSAGRDALGPWSIRNGKVNRDQPERDWPPFITDGGESFMLDSMAAQVEKLPATHTLKRAPAAGINLPAYANQLFDRISATRTSRSGPAPNTVELWIDPATHLIERIEYHWDTAQHSTNNQGSHPSPPRGDRRQPPPNDQRGGGPGSPHDSPPPPPPPPPPPGDHQQGPHGPPPNNNNTSGPANGKPRGVIFQRVDAPNLPSDWFTPEGHLSASTAP